MYKIKCNCTGDLVAMNILRKSAIDYVNSVFNQLQLSRAPYKCLTVTDVHGDAVFCATQHGEIDVTKHEVAGTDAGIYLETMIRILDARLQLDKARLDSTNIKAKWNVEATALRVQLVTKLSDLYEVKT